LYLLVIDEEEQDEVVEHNGKPLDEIKGYFHIEKDEQLPTETNYLEVNTSLQNLLPTSLEELKYLSYTSIDEREGKEEKAVLISKRLPKSGSNTTVYLVSLENNFGKNKEKTKDDDKDKNKFKGIKKGEKYILPYFFKWQFHSLDEKMYCITDAVYGELKQELGLPDITSILNKPYKNTEALEEALKNKDVENNNYKQIEQATSFPGGNTFHY